MLNLRRESYGPPWKKASTGREIYLPEDHYFLDSPGFPARYAVEITVTILASWADEYEVGIAGSVRELKGNLVGGPEVHRAEMARVFQWLADQAKANGVAEDLSKWEVIVLEHEIWLLDAHEGLPGLLELTPQQYAQLQSEWVAKGLPADLYYPETAGRPVVEPIQTRLGIVRMSQWYSPLRWQRRDGAAIEALSVPTEQERLAAFEEACRSFLDALALRRVEMEEPGRTSDRELIRELDQVYNRVSDLCRRVAAGRMGS